MVSIDPKIWAYRSFKYLTLLNKFTGNVLFLLQLLWRWRDTESKVYFNHARIHWFKYSKVVNCIVSQGPCILNCTHNLKIKKFSGQDDELFVLDHPSRKFFFTFPPPPLSHNQKSYWIYTSLLLTLNTTKAQYSKLLGVIGFRSNGY